jgi:hypothetical protein
MTIKYRYQPEGNRVKVTVFVAEDSNHTFANAGSFLLSPEELRLFVKKEYETEYVGSVGLVGF